MLQAYRSVLFVPGHRPSWVDKAVASGADAVVLDLEDSVPSGEKAAARETVAASIARVRSSGATVGLLVRVNPLATKLTGADLEAVVVPGLDGVFAPKIEQATDVLQYDALLDHFETRNGVTGLEYIVPVETVKAIQNAREIASASPRVGAMIGPTAEHADIARAVGYEWTPEGLETLYLRSRVLLACREAGIHPLTGLWEDLENLGPDYDRTLMAWHERFQAAKPRLGLDRQFERMWDFYLASCAAAFHGGNCDVTQITMSRPV